MRIWFVDQGEPLPFQAGLRLQRYGELTRVLARRGHQVVWWANDFSHEPRGYIGQPNAHVMHDGVEIVLVHGSGYERNVSLARFKHVAVHARHLERLIADAQRPDVVVCGMPTIESSKVLSAYGAKNGVPVIIDIRDEWPEDYVRVLPKFLRPLGRLALYPQFRTLHQALGGATAIAAVTETQLTYGLRHAGRERRSNDAVFYSGARITPPDRAQIEAHLVEWRQMGLNEGDFVCAFTGSLSPLRPLGAAIEAVKRLSANTPIKLVLAGKGDCLQQYQAQAAGCPDILFPGWVDAPKMTALNEIADVLLAPYSERFGFSMPTKIFDYMAAGRPILSSCPGEARALIERENIGLNIVADDPASIETALVALCQNPERRREMGQRARTLFERQFALESILERYADYIERMGGASVA